MARVCHFYITASRFSLFCFFLPISPSGESRGNLYVWKVRDGHFVNYFQGKGHIFEVANVEETRVAACFSTSIVNAIDFRPWELKHLAKSFVGYLHFLKRDYVAILYNKDCTFCDLVVRHILELKSDLTIVTIQELVCIIPNIVKKYCWNSSGLNFLLSFSLKEKIVSRIRPDYEYSVEYGLVSKEHMWKYPDIA